MIDVNRIRSLKTLEEMRGDLLAFLSNPEIKNIYLEDHKWGEEDYDADKESVELLLERVEHRIKSLGKFVAKQKSSPRSHRTKKSEGS